MVSSMSISIARGSFVIVSGPFPWGGHRGQDRIDVAAGLQAKGRTTVVEQVEFDVAAAAHQLLFAIRWRPRRTEIPADQIGIDLQKRAADVLGKGEIGIPVSGIMVI